jgi:DNA helicase-2/ATP-dependent DNA helicase PcrA
LVVAGPGSGKTRVLSARLAFLLQNGYCSPKEILVLSFTNSAADNLCAKASAMISALGTAATTTGVYCDTFHGFCSSVIRTHYSVLTRSQARTNLIIADDDDQMRIMVELLQSKGMPGGKSKASEILRQIRYWKELGLGYLGVRPKSLTKHTEKIAYELYPEYQARLKMLSALDFGDLLLNTLRLFRQNPAVLESYRNRFKHILVDEFQDVTPAQYDILRMLVLGATSGGSPDTSSGGGGRRRRGAGSG